MPSCDPRPSWNATTLAGAAALIGRDNLEFVSNFGGLEQIELNRRLVLAPDLFADEEKAWMPTKIWLAARKNQRMG